MGAEEIRLYLHCRMCIVECPNGQSMAWWARLAVGLTPRGLQVWCERHDAEVATFDFDRLDGWQRRLPSPDGPVDCDDCLAEISPAGER